MASKNITYFFYYAEAHCLKNKVTKGRENFFLIVSLPHNKSNPTTGELLLWAMTLNLNIYKPSAT